MEQIAIDLDLIVSAFNLGNLKGWETKQSEFKGYTVVYFDTTKETNLKYYFKNQTS